MWLAEKELGANTIEELISFPEQLTITSVEH